MPVVCTSIKEEFIVIDKQVYFSEGECVALEHNTYWSSTMTSSCWVYCCARRRARSLASELSEEPI